jgi:hypothetical protein
MELGGGKRKLHSLAPLTIGLGKELFLVVRDGEQSKVYLNLTCINFPLRGNIPKNSFCGGC